MADLKELFEQAQANRKDDKIEYTQGETDNFKKAFDDPEFRRMFTEYMDEMQDPNNRKETEDYIKQLEGEQKVPQGKELVRPIACFVAKTYKIVDGVKGDKVFINIVSSESIMQPSKTVSAEGEVWSLPYSLGPPHMERDKNDSNVACFDCCYHPSAMAQIKVKRQFRESLILTAIEGVEEAYKRQSQETVISKEYHVLKGISYKQGLIPAMLVDTAMKNQEWSQNGESNKASRIEKELKTDKTADVKADKTADVKADKTADVKADKTADVKASESNKNNIEKVDTQSQSESASQLELERNDSLEKVQSAIEKKTSATAPALVPAPAIKKGFLNSAKSTVYPESITAKNKKAVNSVNSPAIILPSKASSEKSENKSVLSSTNGLLRTGGVVSTGSGSMVQELSAEELQQLKKTGTVRKTQGQGQGQGQATALSSSAMLSPSPSVSRPVSAGVGTAQSRETEESAMSSYHSKDSISNNSNSSSSNNNNSSSSNSSNGVSSPKSTTTTTTGVTITQGPQNDPGSPSNRPQYSLIERGLVSMGDFETLKDKVASNRPAELVCKIQVPLVTKASLMVLDVAERELKFSYLDLYSLSLALPYPIFDKKGIAKYDKALKSLTVTMPVQPPLQPIIESNPSISAVPENDNGVVEKLAMNGEDALKLSKEEVEKEVLRKKASNSRWVGSESGAEREEAKKRTDHLTEEIKTKLQETKESIGSSPLLTITPNHTLPGPRPSVPAGALSPAPPGFTPSSVYLGTKEGLVFQKGQHGMGYYTDSTHTTPLPPTPLSVPISPPSSATPNPPKGASITSTASIPGSSLKSCPFEYKQTKQAIAVLIQVPDILMDSVTVSFGDSTAEVEFRALGSDSRVLTDDHVNPTISSDPSLARITSINTIANAATSTSTNTSSKEEINTSNLLNSQQNRATVLYRFVLIASGRLSKSLCKYDVASINMVLVLTKEEEGYWTESDKSPVLVMAECTAVTGGEGEQRIEPEPTLISLEKSPTKGIEKRQSDNISNLKKENKGTDFHLAEELKKMKFATRPDFELD